MISINRPMYKRQGAAEEKTRALVYIGIGRNFLNRIIILYVCRYQAKSE